MSEDPNPEGATQQDTLAGPAPAKNKKKILIVAAAVLLVGGGSGAFFLMGGDEAHAEEEAASESAEVGFVEVPPMVVNLRTTGGQPRFLKVHFLIVPASQAKKEEIQAKLPLVIDRFQPFLRELRPDDLSGSAAVYRIKEEMMVRAGKVLGDGAVRDILIQDLIEK